MILFLSVAFQIPAFQVLRFPDSSQTGLGPGLAWAGPGLGLGRAWDQPGLGFWGGSNPGRGHGCAPPAL